MSSAYPAVCFASRSALAPVPAVLRLTLSASHQEALAELLPVLLCGEESAALAFGRFSGDSAFSQQARAELQLIGQEEQRHERALQALRQALPPSPLDAEVRTAARRFFARISGRDPGEHFARIAALDSGVCVLLGALLKRGSPLAADATVGGLMSHIHRDEARHVRVSRRYTRLLLNKRQSRAIAFETRTRLAMLMALRGTALEALGVDANRLLQRLRLVPRAL